MEKNNQWYVDQYNRNRDYKDQVKDYKELKTKLTEVLTKKEKLDGNRKKTL